MKNYPRIQIKTPPGVGRNMLFLSSPHLCFIIVFREIAVCFLWLLLPDDYRVTDEALLAETT